VLFDCASNPISQFAVSLRQLFQNFVGPTGRERLLGRNSTRKGLKKELVFGDPIEKPDLYVGCRVGVNFTSFSVFQQR
jgi:hypothetical protein